MHPEPWYGEVCRSFRMFTLVCLGFFLFTLVFIRSRQLAATECDVKTWCKQMRRFLCNRMRWGEGLMFAVNNATVCLYSKCTILFAAGFLVKYQWNLSDCQVMDLIITISPSGLTHSAHEMEFLLVYQLIYWGVGEGVTHQMGTKALGRPYHPNVDKKQVPVM